ncbi:transposable element Tcb1 transposase [Trichonephila clavipes]|nr:transposable element Tcb1 transposase [Trichonephila clavipes]
MVRGAIAYNTWSCMVLIRGTMTTQWYVHDILQPYVFPILQRLPEGQCLASHDKGSQDCFCTVTTLPWPARSPDLSPIEHIWDHFGQ